MSWSGERERHRQAALRSRKSGKKVEVVLIMRSGQKRFEDFSVGSFKQRIQMARDYVRQLSFVSIRNAYITVNGEVVDDLKNLKR